MVKKEFLNFEKLHVKDKKNPFLGYKPPTQTTLLNGPICQVVELIKIDVCLHIYSKFNQN
jgi:hypothetical protein